MCTLHEKQPSVDIIFPPALLGYNSGSIGNVGMSPRSGGPIFEPLVSGLIVDKQCPYNKKTTSKKKFQYNLATGESYT